MVVNLGTGRCPGCGMELPGEAWSADLCPRCLFGLAVEESPTEAPTLAFDDDDEELKGPTFSQGQLLGARYRIASLLGRGGMGEVWRAYDLKLRLEVALKSLHPKLFETEDALDLLRDEVRAAREVTSPNVCRLYDLVEVGDQELVSMEYIDGVTLLEYLGQHGPLELQEANEIGSQLLAGLEAVHRAGLVHRDVKPENVMLTRTGRVVVMDFGLTSPSGSGAIGGTPAYMPPEQARGDAADARADVFSAGMVLAEMLSAEAGPDESSRQSFWEAIRKEPPLLPESPWKRILSQAVSPDAEIRHATAAELARALEEVAFRVEGVEHEHPYPGLATFQASDAEFFFGREAEVEAVWKKLQQAHLLGLIGPSGSGKSSFINAGLIPASPDGWFCVRMTPGTDPFASLGRALLPELETDREAMGLLASLEGPEPALEVLRRQRSKHVEFLLLVDQLEELFTQSSRDQQQRFSELVGRAGLDADVHVLLSMRDDYLMHCRAHESLAPLFSDLTALLPPMGSALRRAVVQPALRCGYRFEDEAVVEEMLQEVTKERAALPLIAFTAAQLWERRDQETGYLTNGAYEAMGGVGGALAQHAETTLEKIGQGQIPVVRELFRNLVTAQGTRAARERDELLSVFEHEEPAGRGAGRFKDDVGAGLAPADGDVTTGVPQAPAPARGAPTSACDDAAQVLDTLIDARLLTSYEIPEREGRPVQNRIEIIHESLLTAWPRLVRWQIQDAEGAKLRDELRHQAQVWMEKDRPDDLLWTDTSYKEYEIWRERYPGGLTVGEEAFAQAITEYAERQKRRRRIAISTAFGILLAVLVIVGVALKFSIEAARRAEAANLLSQAHLRLEDHPSAALAFATASLEMEDNLEVRQLVVEALWRGPTEFRLQTGSPYTVDFSPDGQWLFTAAVEGDGMLWPSDGDPATPLEESRSVYEGRISPTGDLIACNLGGEGKSVGLWSIPSGRFIRSFDLGGFSTRNFRISRGGKRLIASSERVDGEDFAPGRREVKIQSWPVEGTDPNLIARLELSRETVQGYVDVDPTESRLAWVEGTKLKFRRAAGAGPHRAPVTSLEHDQAIAWAVFDQDARRLATADLGGMVKLWSLESGPPDLTRTLRDVGVRAPWSIRFDPAGEMLGSSGMLVWRLDAAPGADPIRLRRAAGAIEGEQEEIASSVAFHPKGLWMATGHSYSVSLWPLVRFYPQILQGHDQYVENLEFTPDGKSIVSTSGDGSVRLWSLDGSSKVGSRVLYQGTGTSGAPRRLAMAPDGSFVVIGTFAGQVQVLPLDGGAPRNLGGFNDLIGALAVAPGERLVAAGGGIYVEEESIVRIWDLETGEARILDAGDGKRIQRLEFAGDDSLWSTTGPMLRHWSVAGEEPKLVEEIELSGPESKTGYVRDLRTDDRQALFGGSRGGSGGLWSHDLNTGTSKDLSTHGNLVYRAIFDPSGATVVSADKQGIVRVGPGTGEEPHLLLGHKGEINAVAFSLDGKWIATGGDDKTIRLWPQPDLSKAPLHTWPREELLTKLRSLTNLRAAEDPDSTTGWKLVIDSFPGWEEVPTW